jgi:hypothetical protein
MNHASTKIGGAATARAAGTPSRPAAGTGPAATWQDRAKAVAGLRLALYPRLPPIARSWWARLGRETPWPDSLQEWLAMCHDAGQARPTPILLKYLLRARGAVTAG